MHTVESIVSSRLQNSHWSGNSADHVFVLSKSLAMLQLVSVISLLSADVPDLSSPANVDAAKQVREDFPAYKKKVRRLVRQSAEEAYD